MILIVLIIMFALFAIGVPIAYTLGITGLVAVLSVGTITLEIVPLQVMNGALSYTLIAIPLFLLMGEIMNKSSISNRLIDFASALVGFIKGGLGMATVLTGMVMAAISGSSVADAAALGSVLIPQFDKRGYGKPFGVAIVSAAASIAQVIPPSITMILYAVSAGVSMSDLFMAGMIPGVSIGLGLMVVVYIFSAKNKIPRSERFDIKLVWKELKRSFLGLLLPLIVIGGILGGIFTPTEAGGIGVLYSLILGMFVYRELGFKDLVKCLVGAAKQSAIIILMVGTSALLGYWLTQQQIPQALAGSILSVSGNKHIVGLLVMAIFFIGGMFLHGTPLTIMLVPMVVPLMNEVGIDLVQFGIVVCICISIGQITPPVASVLMTASGVGGISIDKVVKPLLPMLGVLVLVCMLVLFWPPLSLWLPTILGGG